MAVPVGAPVRGPHWKKDVAKACGFFLGPAAFFPGIDGWCRHDGRCDRLSPVLRVEDQAAEAAGLADRLKMFMSGHFRKG